MMADQKKIIAILLIVALIFQGTLPQFTGKVMEARAEQLTEQETPLVRAIHWLQSQQGEIGKWGNDGLPNLTCNALAVLRKAGAEADDKYLSIWEKEHSALNVDEQAHLVWGHGDKEKLEDLLKCANPDGGYGLDSTYTSEIYDTLMVLMAAVSLEETEKEAVTEAAEYIMAKQQNDGGFVITEDNTDKALTADIGYVMLSLNIKNKIFYEKLDAYCLKAYTGEFTTEKFCEQAKLARYLIKRNLISNVAEIKDTLLAIQSENGSICDGVEQTIQYILLLLEVEEFYKLRFEIIQFQTEMDSYVLESGVEQTLHLTTEVGYCTNQRLTGIVTYHLMENGVENHSSEQKISLPIGEKKQTIQEEMTVSAIMDKKYSIKIELILYGQDGTEVFRKNQEISLTIQETKESDLILQAQVKKGKSYGVTLRWNEMSDEKERYGYRLYREKKNGEWETKSTWNGEEKVKVLNIYPHSLAENYLDEWLNTTVSGTEEVAGKGLFEIDKVYIDDFNCNPEQYLLNENGEYKHDVLMYGTYDCNALKDINQKAYNATQEFIDSGRGVLFGHDTVGNNFAHRCPTFRGFADQMGIRLIPDYDYSACRKVKVVNNGFLTSYPWKLSGTLDIPATHSTSQYAGGSLDSTVWLEFEKRGLTDEETGAKNTAYLCTNNSLALIQTGHSSGQATDDERKILANTLFYLKQLTNQTEAKDESFYDTEKPEKPEISGSYSTQGKSAWVQIGGKDKGTAYRYRVEAISTTNRDGQVRESNIVDAEAISGIKGYLVGVNDSEEEMNELVTYDDQGNLLSEVFGEGEENYEHTLENLEVGKIYYIHVRAVDYAGNVSEESVQKIMIESSTPTYQTLENALIATEKSISINCCQADINKNIYAGENFCFGGSILNADCLVKTKGNVMAYAWIINSAKKQEQVETLTVKDYTRDIEADIKNDGEEYLQLDMYNSTTITVPTFCQGTTGAYCTTLDIAKPLVSDGSIFINCNETTIGSEDEKAVLCSMNGDININATKANVYGLIYAPKGTVSINVSEFDLVGTIIAKEIKLNGSYVRINQ